MSADRRLRRIAVVGGGTAGWAAAAILARALPGYGCEITLVESPVIPTVGVGEATIPPFVDLLRFLSIDEADFIRHTGATYKLGIRFDDWRREGERYWHPFGTLGAPINRRPFFHAWHRARREGMDPRLADYSACVQLAEAGRAPDPAADPLPGVRHALHFDAHLVARYLAAYAQALGVKWLQRTVQGATRRADGGLDDLVLDGGERLSADLYLDCSGFRALLMGETLGVGLVDWSALLPCDSAVAAPTAARPGRAPFTRATARAAGWRWTIPLQHRTGNGYVYCRDAIGDEAALADFLATIDGEPLAEPRVLRFRAGRREAFWKGNCIAVGLASGFLEPLESTSIHLAISGVLNLLEHFPDRDFDPVNIAAYNAELVEEVERVRDFIVLHYALTERDDTPFWRQARALTLPDSLLERLEAYRATGRVRPRPGELFTDLSWFYVLDGLGVRPAAYDPLIDVMPSSQLAAALGEIRADISRGVRGARPHDEVLPTAGH